MFACVRACIRVRACVRACVRVCVYVRACVRTSPKTSRHQVTSVKNKRTTFPAFARKSSTRFAPAGSGGWCCVGCERFPWPDVLTTDRPSPDRLPDARALDSFSTSSRCSRGASAHAHNGWENEQRVSGGLSCCCCWGLFEFLALTQTVKKTTNMCQTCSFSPNCWRRLCCISFATSC